MNNIIKGAVLSLAFIASSCTNLDVDINSKYTEYPDSPVAIEAKMADVYYAFRAAYGEKYNVVQTLSSDEQDAISFDGDYWDDGIYSHPTLHNFKADENEKNSPLNYWADLSAGITKCNQVIADLEDINATPESIAPARTMRAFYHFILMDSFGDVPLLDRIPEDDAQIDRTARKTVAEWIEKELTECVPLLSSENNAATYGKPNRWMAEALLVKLYINWMVYTCGDVATYEPSMANPKLNNVVTLCDDIIKSGCFDLGKSYREKFYPNNGSHIKDFIYAMPFDCVSAPGMTYGRFRTFRRIDDSNGGYYGGKMGNSCAGIYVLTPEFSDLFTLEGDERNEVIMKGTVYKYDPTTYQRTDEKFLYKNTQEVSFTRVPALLAEDETLNAGANINGWSQGHRSIKFFVNPTEYREHSRSQNNDVPVFRYADILLTKAEAILRGATPTNGDTPQSLFNQIRAYVNAPLLTSAPSLQDLLDERGREFIDENWRRNDMIRFGTFESEYGFHRKNFPNARFDRTCRILPVPRKVMKENTNWKQNPGYGE